VGDSDEFVQCLCVVDLGPVISRARVLVHELLDRGAQTVARCASQVFDRGTQADVRGATQVLGRGAKAVARVSAD
jgi:hypothetical protein